MFPTEQTYESLLEENAQLKQHIHQLSGDFSARIDQITKNFETKIRLMQLRMDDLLKRVYGRSSEKLHPDQLLMNDILLEADRAVKAESSLPGAPVTATVVKEHVRHKHGRSALPEHLKRVEHMQDIAEAQKVCFCGKALKHIGDDVTERIDCQPSSLFVNAYIRPKYACPDCNCDGCGVKQAPAPGGPIDRCEADAGMLANVIVEKFEHHMPLYRQEQKLQRAGVMISRQTMADWLEGCARATVPLVELIKEEIFRSGLVLNDDTPVDMRDGPDPGITTARFWATVGGEGLKYTMYNFTTGRSKDGPVEFFRDFRGTFVSDDYAGYNDLFKADAASGRAVGDIVNSACWTHVRRYFVKAADAHPRDANAMLMLIAKLYEVEKDMKTASADERKAARQKIALPIIDEKIKPWLEEHLAASLPQSPLRKAIEHMLRLWKELHVYLTDGRIPIDNNLAENAIRPIALGRKNWLFVGSETGGHTAAALMTLTATCRKNKINTWEYLKDVIQRVQSHPAKRLRELLPDQWQSARQ